MKGILSNIAYGIVIFFMCICMCVSVSMSLLVYVVIMYMCVRSQWRPDLLELELQAIVNHLT